MDNHASTNSTGRLAYRPRCKYHIAAEVLVRRLCVYGAKKKELGDSHRSVIRSRGTARAYENCVANFLSFRAQGGAPSGGPYLRAEFDEFLHLNSLAWQQKTVDQHWQALTKVFSVVLPRYRAAVPSYVKGRAYTHEEFEKILTAASSLHRLSIALLYYCGLRVEEILQISDLQTDAPSPDRPWRKDLFSEMHDVVICTVTGKGGLRRAIAVPTHLYNELVKHRMHQSGTVRNRRSDFSTHFDLVGGQALSQAFTRASRAALGFSLGAHGLRYSYIQQKLADLRAMGLPEIECLAICSQHAGHFREDITLHYTTPRRHI
jgi:integrase